MNKALLNYPEMVVDIKITIEEDKNPDLSFLGEYTDNRPPEEDLKRHTAFDSKYQDPKWWDGLYRYFVPMTSVSEHRSALSKMGYSRGMAEYLARSYCRRDFDMRRDYGDGWHMVFILVETITTHGRGASACVGGVHSGDTAFHETVIRALIDEVRADLGDVDFAGWDELVDEAIAGRE